MQVFSYKQYKQILSTMTRAEKIQKQIELQDEIIEKAGINMVTCGMCGTTMLHRLNEEELECPDCGFKSEPCDFPDIYFRGMFDTP